MTLLIATRNGVYRTTNDSLDAFEHVLDAGDTLRVRTFENHDGVFAASKSGLYRSHDAGTTWEALAVPQEEVFSIVGSPDGRRLYAGTHPAHVYVSDDHGASWDELESFQALSTRNDWHTPRHRNAAHVRSLGVHSDAPSRVIAGVEVGGIYVSDDNGETWNDRRTNPDTELDLQDDIHHILVLGSDTFIASCGEGLFRTQDTGRSWTRIDEQDDLTYFREAFHHEGVLYAGAHTKPGTWDHGTGPALLEYHIDSQTAERASYPGESSNEFVIAWTSVNRHVLAGTNTGRLLGREDDGWRTVGKVPDRIRSISKTT